MAPQRIGILHPGAMGVSIAAAAVANGHEVYWASHGRSAQSKERAQQQHLRDAGSIKALCATCQIILSICPPHAAEDVAEEVVGYGFRGLYVDANAIAPQRALRIGQLLDQAGAELVDGGIIGGPAWGPDKTHLHLSGTRAATIATLLATQTLSTHVVSERLGDASSLKMCFAAYTKGSIALLCAIVATAENLGVREALFAQWQSGRDDLSSRAIEQMCGATSKAWRFTGEMREIASTFAEAGQPSGFHEAAAQIYQRIAHFKDTEADIPFDRVLAALAGNDD